MVDFVFSVLQTLTKTGLEEKFFKVVGHKNPLEKKKFHELTFFQRVWITKALCDWCMVRSLCIQLCKHGQEMNGLPLELFLF